MLATMNTLKTYSPGPITPTVEQRLQPEQNISIPCYLRDGPLENLWGGGGAGEVQKKYSREAKLNEKKFMHAK